MNDDKSKPRDSRTEARPEDDPWAPLIESLGMFSDDFMKERDQGVQEEREEMFGDED